MYLVKNKIIEQLNINESTFELYRTLKMFKYSKKTDKYDISTILAKRTMTIGLEKIIPESFKNTLEEKMNKYSSLKFKLTKDIQNGIKLSNTGKNRLHREIGKSYGFSTLESDSCLKSVEGHIKSSETWYEKTIKELEDKILDIRNQLEKDLIKNKEGKTFKPNYFKGKRTKLRNLENKLEKLQSKSRLKIHYGKSIYKKLQNERYRLLNEANLNQREKLKLNINRLKSEYKRKRLEYFIEGSVILGNKRIVIEENENGYQLRFIFGRSKTEQYIIPIKIPNSHKTFSVKSYNKQSMRIAYNSKGKLVLHCTYSYIKPFSLEVELGQNSNGTCGIDIGPKEITCVLVKKDGNPFKKVSYNIGNILDKRDKETNRSLSEIIEKVIDFTVSNGFYSITIENLQFKDIKYNNTSKLNRLLSKFPHEKFEQLIQSKTTRKGIKLKKINPKYTSFIGLQKYSCRSDITLNHNSNSKDYTAALVVGRRGLGFKERTIISTRLLGKKIASFNVNALLNKSVKELSITNHCNKSNWSIWSKLIKHKGEVFNYINQQTANNSSKPLCAFSS